MVTMPTINIGDSVRANDKLPYRNVLNHVGDAIGTVMEIQADDGIAFIHVVFDGLKGYRYPFLSDELDIVRECGCVGLKERAGCNHNDGR